MIPEQIELSLWWWGAVSYLSCHVLHVVIWNRKILEPGLKLLALIFFGVPFFLYFIFLISGGSFWNSLCPVAIHSVLSANYFAIYPAVQASSPTLVILDSLFRNPRGQTQEEILALFSDSQVLRDRFNELRKAKFIFENEGKVQLTFLGRSVADFFSIYRRLLGYAPGEG